MKKPIPFIAVPPGFLLRRELEARDITIAKFAPKLGLTPTELEKLLEGEIAITPDIANVFANEWDEDAGVLLRLQASYDAHPKNPWGGQRNGAGRKPLELNNKQVRVSAKPDEMLEIEHWLKTQKSAPQALAQLILRHSRRTKPHTKSRAQTLEKPSSRS